MIKFSVFIIYITLNLVGCNSFDSLYLNYDIYKHCKKGDTLSFELFQKTKRLIKTEKWYFIWIDLLEDNIDIRYGKYILVCDLNLTLKGATNIFPEITEAHGDTLFGMILENYISLQNAQSKKYYQHDLPDEIVISGKKRDKPWNGYQTDPFAIIDSIKLDQNFEFAKFYLRTNDSICIPYRRDYFDDIQIFFKEINIFQILEIPISKLYVDSKECIYTLEPNDTRKEMYTLSDEITEKLILELWNSIKYKKIGSSIKNTN